MSVLCPSAVVAGKYRLARLLGEGGMGQVWLAENVVLQKQVALKVIRDAGEADGLLVERFLREAITASRVPHPAIVEIHDAGIDEGRPWIAMELLEGESLAARIAQRPLAVDELRALLLPIVDALAALHDAGIVHRDLKPDNIFLERRADGSIQPKLLDFGIAKQLAVSALTKTGELIGTGHYLSPEQARGARDLDARSDLYSMGVVLFEALSGRTPYEAESLTELIAKLFTEPPRSLRQVQPSVPEAVAQIVHRCLAREPMGRPYDARALHRMLVDALASTSRPLAKTVAESPPPVRAPVPVRAPAPVRAPVPVRAAVSPSRGVGIAVFILGVAMAASVGLLGAVRAGTSVHTATTTTSPVARGTHATSVPPRVSSVGNAAPQGAAPVAPDADEPASPIPSGCDESAAPSGHSVVRTGTIETLGGLSRQDVRSVVRAELSDVSYCHDAALALCASISGRTELNLAIAHDGRVEAVTLGPTTLADGGHVEGCVMRAMRGWRFPARALSTQVALAFVLDVEPGVPETPHATPVHASAREPVDCARGSLSVLAPVGATITIDGRERREAAYGGEARVCAGSHLVRVVGERGRVLLQQRVAVPEGIRVEVDGALHI